MVSQLPLFIISEQPVWSWCTLKVYIMSSSIPQGGLWDIVDRLPCSLKSPLKQTVKMVNGKIYFNVDF